jgi:rRNA-processing protein FCF1
MLTSRFGRDTVSLSNRINALNTSSTSALRDTASALRAKILLDSNALATNINTRVRIVDTSAMLSPYATTAATASLLATKLNISDTSAMLTNRIGRDTVSLSDRINALNTNSTTSLRDTATVLRAKILLDSNALASNINTKVNISDTASMLSPYARNSTVSSTYLPLAGGVLTGALTGTTITGTSFVKSGGTSAQFLKADGSVDATSYENLSNKSTNTLLGNSDTLYPTQNAVKSYVDGQIAVTTIPDATALAKGKVQLAGDLGGTAASPTVPGLTLKANTADVTAGLALKENLSNKSIITTLGTSDVLYPTQNAVKTYVDAKVNGIGSLNSINGLTASTQTFATGTSGSDVNISSSTSTHTFNFPSASASVRGLVTISAQSFAGLKTFTNGATVTGTLTAGGTTFPSSTGSTGQALTLSSSGVATWSFPVREVADEFSATSGQTSFSLSQVPNTASKVKMFVNGIRISNNAYSISSSSLTYSSSNNGGYTLNTGDRIQFDYYY